MAATPIEIIAGVFVIASLVKIAAIFAYRQEWLDLTKKFYEKRLLTRVFLGILSIVILWYLLQSFTIVEIIAVAAFVSVLVAYEMMEYPEEALDIAKKVLNEKFSNPQMFYITFWIVLLLWAAKELFL